jgi:hypothetical protein
VNVGKKRPTASILRRGTWRNASHALKAYQDRRWKLLREIYGCFGFLLIARRFVVNFVYCRMDTSIPLMEHKSAIPKAVLGSAKLEEAAYLNVARIMKITLHLVMVNLLY